MTAKSRSGHDITPLTAAAIRELAADLTAAEADVILGQGTERPFCGSLLAHKTAGTYSCRLCGLPLFASDAKFESGTGWPSFFAPYDPDHVATFADHSHGMSRTEIACRRCRAHLGHVFDDGPPPTGKRYCLNSVSLRFTAEAGGGPADAER